MKKAKVILASLAILAVIGGALAFKASRLPAKQLYILLDEAVVGPQWSSYTNAQGLVFSTTIPPCTLTNVFTTTQGTPVITSTSTSAALVRTFFTRAGSSPIQTTYHYCTQKLVATTNVD